MRFAPANVSTQPFTLAVALAMRSVLRGLLTSVMVSRLKKPFESSARMRSARHLFCDCCSRLSSLSSKGFACSNATMLKFRLLGDMMRLKPVSTVGPSCQSSRAVVSPPNLTMFSLMLLLLLLESQIAQHGMVVKQCAALRAEFCIDIIRVFMRDGFDMLVPFRAVE